MTPADWTHTMTIPQFSSIAEAVKVAAIVVHAQEFLSPDGHEVDVSALRALVQTPEVNAWLAQFEPALLPLKRRSWLAPPRPREASPRRKTRSTAPRKGRKGPSQPPPSDRSPR